MTDDLRLAEQLYRALAIQPPGHCECEPENHGFESDILACHFCHTRPGHPNDPCYARVLTDANEALKLLWTLPKAFWWVLTAGDLEINSPSVDDKPPIHVSQELTNESNESLCRAILHTIGEALEIKEGKDG